LKRGKTSPLSIAPMMDRTDRHYRYFMRQITKHTLLYTEMVTTKAIIHGDRKYLLGYDEIEHPISLQVGGDDPKELAICAQIAEDLGYDEININVGCPSSRVQSGNFGACLMSQPELVAEGVAAMRAVVSIPVTVKHRIGIDEMDRYEDLYRFVEIVSKANADRFSVHARKAWLKGLSPKQNRTVPPLRYDDVYRLKREFSDLDIEINGGIKTMLQAKEHLSYVDAVMIGRAAYDRPWEFSTADSMFFSDDYKIPTRLEVVSKMIPYIERKMTEGVRMMSITRHMLQLFSHRSGAKLWKREVGTASAKTRADLTVLKSLLKNPILFCSE
jgi:tRNA-dihydrouridine synthase A